MKAAVKELRVIGYIRVSTEEQAEDGVSLAAQREKLVAYARLYDLNLVEIIEDAAQSAKTLNRPGLQRALATIRRGEADGLLIAKLDRLSRSVVDWNELIDGYFGEKAGKQLFSVADSIDTRTAAGRLVLNVLMSVAQWERETIGERTTAALQYKKTQGQRVGTVPYGFDLAGDGIALIANAAEQRVPAIILGLRADGLSLRAIAAELTRREIPTKERGTVWSHTTIQRIVNRGSRRRRIRAKLDELGAAVAALPADRAALLMENSNMSMIDADLRAAIVGSGLSHYALAKLAGIAPSNWTDSFPGNVICD